MKRGFTLIELIIVVIIIGILAAVAVPQYVTVVERAKVGKAKNAIALLATAEKMYRADKSIYVPCDTNTNITSNLGGYTEMDEVIGDKDWNYTITAVVSSSFVITATRNVTSGCTLTLTQSGAWGYSGTNCQY